MNSSDVIINSDSESIAIQFTLFCEFWVELKTGEAYLHWVWIESGLYWIEYELNLNTVKSKWIESELGPGLHCQESWPKQIKFTSSEISPANFFFSSPKLLMAVLHSLVFLTMIGQSFEICKLWLAVKSHNNGITIMRLIIFIGQLPFKVSFAYTFNLNEHFAKGKHMACIFNKGDIIARHLGLWKGCCVAVDMLVEVVTDTM